MSAVRSATGNAALHQRMVSAPICGLVTRMAIPTVISQLITVIYNTADTYFVSQLNDHSASGAVGVVFSLMSLIQAFGFGIGMGAASLVSTRLGEKKDDEASAFASSAFVAALSVGLFLLIFGFPLRTPLMRLLGATETILPHACAYGGYILLGAPVMCSAFVLNSVLRAQGMARLSMVGLCVGGALNVILDPILIFGAGMGVEGAAIATVISQLVSFLILISFFFSGKSAVRLRLGAVSRRFFTYAEIVRRGFPTICRQSMASVSSALLNIAAGNVGGDIAITAMTVANKIYSLVRNVIVGIGQGFQPVAGYNYGAGKKKRVREAFFFATGLGSAICLAAALFLFPFAEGAIAWFYDSPEVVKIGAAALRFTAVILPTMAYSTYVNQLYQSLGFSTVAALLASCRQGIFFLPIILILPSLCGITGITAAQPLADLLTFLISLYFQLRFFYKVLNTQEEKGI